MARVIISYRRIDSAAITGRMRDRLVGTYGPTSVFMDVENIPLGIDFRDHIRNELMRSDLLVVVVGREWLGKDASGASRMQSETDPVRIEVETALQNAIPIIPVLVNGAQMPEPHELPDSLKKFAYLNAASVDSGRDFHAHMDRLMAGIDAIAAARRKQKVPAPGTASTEPARAERAAGARQLLPIAGALAAVLVLVGGAGWWLLASPPPVPVMAATTVADLTPTSSIAAPARPEAVIQTVSLQTAATPAVATPVATAVIAGTYLAQAKPGCGAQRQSIKVAIKDGRVSWQHDALNATFRWEGTIDSDGRIKAAVSDRPGLQAAGRYYLDEREIAMTYPQCGPVTMLIGQMLSR